MTLRRRVTEGLLEIASRAGIWDALARITTTHLTVLAYHRVADPYLQGFDAFLPNVSATPEMFAWQMDYAAARFNVVALDRFVSWLVGGTDLPSRPLLITFDDGYADNFTHALPVLTQRRLPAVLFLTTGFIDQRTPFYWDLVAYCFAHTPSTRLSLPGVGEWTWDDDAGRTRCLRALVSHMKQLTDADKSRLAAELPDLLGVKVPVGTFDGMPMNWDQVRQMEANGVAIGGHTRSHAILTRISVEQAKEEIVSSTSRLETEIGKPVLAFAYPNGLETDFTTEHEKLLAQLGYRTAFSLLPGPMRACEARARPFAIRRILISHKDGHARFAAKLSYAARLAR
jgi:peptidoglycan/xylan/chitin deacetylase (PgdA/CDA1 family)